MDDPVSDYERSEFRLRCFLIVICVICLILIAALGGQA